MTTLVATPNATHVVRDWLRTVTELTDFVGSTGAIAAGKLPGVGRAVVVYRAGGGADITGELVTANIAADCWTADSESDAWTMAGLIEAAAKEVGLRPVGDAILHAVTVTSTLWQPDDLDRPRYVVTMMATITRSV